MPNLAVAQLPPVWLDRVATLESCAQSVAKAAAQGARMLVFPECHVPGYPAWIWRLRPGTDMALASELHARLLHEAVDIERGDLAPLCDAARKHRVSVICGIQERPRSDSGSTLYNSVVLINESGLVSHCHRKLMPTNPERMVWGFGDGSTLKVVDTPLGRVGMLICWENYMPLARYALYAQGVEIYVAPTYDSSDGWVGTLQHIAREARCWVVGASCGPRRTDLPGRPTALEALYPDDAAWINGGASAVVAPGGTLVAGPLRDEHGLLLADIDRDQVAIARRSLDVAGHYARPDVFTLHVDAHPRAPVRFD